MEKSKLAWAIVAALAIAMAVALALVDPAQSAWMPKCPLYYATGIKCPSCGSSRAVHAFLHGNFAEGISYNPFLIISLPLGALIVWLYFFGKSPKAQNWVSPLAIALVVLCLAWMLLRNLFNW